MIEFKVFNNQVPGFSSSSGLVTNNLKQTLTFQIKHQPIDDNTKFDRIQVVFPIWQDSLDQENIPQTECLLSKDEWDKLTPSSFIHDDYSNLEFERKISELGLGRLEITPSNNGDLPEEFKFNLLEFLPNTEKGSIPPKCYLEVYKFDRVRKIGLNTIRLFSYQKVPEPAIVHITKTAELSQAEIVYFKSSRFICASDQNPQLSMDIINEENFRILVNDTEILKEDSFKTIVNDEEILNDKFPLYVDIKEGNNKIKLIVTGSGNPDPVTIQITGVDNNSFGTMDYAFNDIYVENEGVQVRSFNNIVTGLYEYDNKLYAVVLNKERGFAYLYVSEDGFNLWEQIFNGSNLPVKIPWELACSPGVVLYDKLWLIGGSTFDPDQPGNNFGSYNFKTKEWENKSKILDANSESNSTIFTERMGHSCLVYNEEIWILGGYHPEKGTLNDIWTSRNGFKWTKATFTLPNEDGRCMMGATVFNNKILIGAGYKIQPGGDSFLDMYNSDGGRFKKVVFNTNKDLKNELSDIEAILSFDLVNISEKLFLFTSKYTISESDSIYKISIGNNNNWDLGSNMLNKSSFNLDADNESEYHLQATVFKGVIFLRKLQLASHSSDDKGVVGGVVNYFFYVS